MIDHKLIEMTEWSVDKFYRPISEEKKYKELEMKVIYETLRDMKVKGKEESKEIFGDSGSYSNPIIIEEEEWVTGLERPWNPEFVSQWGIKMNYSDYFNEDITIKINNNPAPLRRK